MKGNYEIIVKNARIQYKFTLEKNITILRGDSANGFPLFISQNSLSLLGADQNHGFGGNGVAPHIGEDYVLFCLFQNPDFGKRNRVKTVNFVR